MASLPKRASEETARRGDRRRRARTLVLTGEGSSIAFELPARGDIVIGREPGADVFFDHPSLSRRHARLRITNDGVQLEDLGSKNGTRLAARTLVAGEPVPLPPGTCAELGVVVLLLLDAGAAESTRAVPPGASGGHDAVITPALEPLDAMLLKVADTDLPILLLGETGVGKDVFAERIHARSRRASKRIVRVHASAIAESLFESEIFGHEQGAFTGAVVAKAGLLEVADGGTVFIDEVGDLPPAVQVKFLRVLDDRRVQRVGAIVAKKIDVRFVAATNRDLAAEVARGAFRQDLYQRLRGVALRIPPLRERREDIRLLAAAFLRRIAKDKRFSDDALHALSKHPFWGNVRELRNVVERSALLARGDMLSAADLVFDGAPHAAASPSEPSLPPDQATEKQRIVLALKRANGNQTEAAKLLGMSRRALVYKIGQYAIPRPRKSEPRA